MITDLTIGWIVTIVKSLQGVVVVAASAGGGHGIVVDHESVTCQNRRSRVHVINQNIPCIHVSNLSTPLSTTTSFDNIISTKKSKVM